MSSPGFFMTDEDLANNRKMQMAQALMGNNANPTQNNAGLANLGGDIAGAFAMKNLQNQQDRRNYNAQPNTYSPIDVGGGQTSMLNTKLPYAGPDSTSIFSNLFSFGGGK